MHTVEMEVQQAFNDFVRLGKVLVGCGGAIEILQGEDNILNARPEDVFDAIFGAENIGKDKYGPLKFQCPKGHWNKRPPAKSPRDFLTHCKTCKVSLKC